MDNYQVFVMEFLRCFIYGYPLFISFFQYYNVIFSYPFLSRFSSKAVFCKTFYIFIFLTLFLQEVIAIFLSIYFGFYILKKENIESDSFLLRIYTASVNLPEGLFATNLLLLLWTLKANYEYGHINPSEQLLIPISKKKAKLQKGFNISCLLNICSIVITLMSYYLVFILHTNEVIGNIVTANIFCGFDLFISLISFCFILFYALKYAGNPPVNEKYKKILSNTKVLILLYSSVRIVHLNSNIDLRSDKPFKSK